MDNNNVVSLTSNSNNYISKDVSLYSVRIVHENKNDFSTINVRANETILTALERQSQYITTELNLIPQYDCRRGNCMTCAAKVITGNRIDTTTKTDDISDLSNINQNNLFIRGEDGLSPYVSKQLIDYDYILTCSTTVIGNGLTIQFPLQNEKQSPNNNNKNDNMLHLWDNIYKNRFNTYETQQAGRDCMARVIRKSNEQNIDRWKQETEAILRKQQEQVD